ncbi:MAG: beta-lactamase family protein [Micrococcales bacterium]|nr:beta-lactamase family protein [Micrococcales bacterium]
MRKMTIGSLTALALLLPGLGNATAAPVDRPADKDTVTVRTKGLSNRQVDALAAALTTSQGGLPAGALAGLWVPGKGMWVGAVGEADIARSQPLRPGLQMPVGSITKTLTGTLVLQEVQRGRIALDDLVAKWFPTFPKGDEITVAMLLNMSSGIADYVNGNLPALSKQLRKNPKRTWKPATQIWGAARMPRTFDVPGSQFSYSNTNTVMLGRILTKVTGRSLPVLMKRRVLDEVGMTRSLLDFKVDPQRPYAQSYSLLFGEMHGKRRLLRTTDWSLSLVGAAGALRSTLRDMRHWGTALGTGKGVLPRKTQRERFAHCIDVVSRDGITAAYCLGTMTYREDATGDIVAIWHNGRVLGATGYLGYFPHQGRSRRAE